MRFLCLHGVGTNNQVYEMQSSAIRHELGGSHEFEFVEGSIPHPPGPGIESLVSLSDEFYAYADATDAQSITAAINELSTYIDKEGPFDGLMCFSQGAALGAMYLIRAHQKQLALPVKLAVFFCGEVPADPSAIQLGDIRELYDVEGKILIEIPTAHIWAENDDPKFGKPLAKLCKQSVRETFVHRGGHEVPGPKSKDDVVKAVHAIRRTAARAEEAH